MARAAVVDQVGSPQPAVPAAELFQSWDVVRGVILLQDHDPHSTGVDDQEGQKVHGAVPRIVELPLLDRAGGRPAGGAPFEYVEVGDLIGAYDPLAPPGQPLGVPVAPEDFLGASPESGIEAGRPPVARAVRLQVHPVEDQADGPGADRLDYTIGDELPSQILA